MTRANHLSVAVSGPSRLRGCGATRWTCACLSHGSERHCWTANSLSNSRRKPPEGRDGQTDDVYAQGTKPQAAGGVCQPLPRHVTLLPAAATQPAQSSSECETEQNRTQSRNREPRSQYLARHGHKSALEKRDTATVRVTHEVLDMHVQTVYYCIASFSVSSSYQLVAITQVKWRILL